MFYLKPMENNAVNKDMFVDFFSSNIKESMPKTDIIENENEYIVESEIPGVKKEDIKISFKEDVLSFEVKSENVVEEKDEKRNYIRRERSSKSFKRSFKVDSIEKNSIDASYVDGVLKIVLPKSKEMEKETTIEVK